MLKQQPRLGLLDFYGGYDRWKEEHDSLQERLLDLCRYMRANPDRSRPNGWSEVHNEVRDLFLAFMKDWRRYVRLEKKIIYPVAALAGGSGEGITLSVLMQDDKLVADFFEAYLAACREGVSDEEALSRLFQSLMIIAEHFRIEDESVLPRTERIMDEIAYNGS